MTTITLLGAGGKMGLRIAKICGRPTTRFDTSKSVNGAKLRWRNGESRPSR